MPETEHTQSLQTEIKVVTEPSFVIPAEEAQIQAPEFNFSPEGVLEVQQGDARFTDSKETLFTKGIGPCQLIILRTEIPGQDAPLVRFGYIHAFTGNVTMYGSSYKGEDVSEKIGYKTEAILVMGSRSAPPSVTTRSLEEMGIVVTKHIHVDTMGVNPRLPGNMWLHVAFRPETDEILTKAGSDVDFDVPIQVFTGFGDAEMPTDAFEAAAEVRIKFLREKGLPQVKELLSDIALALNEQTVESEQEARELFAKAQQVIQKYGIVTDSLGPLWKNLVEKLGSKS